MQVPVKEAVKDPEGLKSIQDEVQRQFEMGVIEIVDRPTDPNTEILWPVTVCRTGMADKGKKWKSRICARGDRVQVSPEEAIFNYAPVANISTSRLLISIAAKTKKDLHFVDVKTAFLYAPLPRERYMHIPEHGFEKYGPLDRKKQVLKVKKAIYGLRESAKLWNETLRKALGAKNDEHITVRQHWADPCIFFVLLKGKDGRLSFDRALEVHVDDMMIVGDTDQRMRSVINKNFQTTEKELPATMLGVQITKLPNGDIFMSQQKYIREILEANIPPGSDLWKKPVDTPSDGTVLEDYDPGDPSETPFDGTLAQAVGQLRYPEIFTRGDLTYAVNDLSRFTAPGKASNKHRKALNRIFQYLIGTMDYGLLVRSHDMQLRVFSDSNHPHRAERDVGGYVVTLGDTPLLWKSYRQNRTTCSTFDSELIAASEAAKAALHFSRILQDFGFDEQTKPILYCDNSSVVMTCNSSSGALIAKHGHVERREQLVRELVQRGRITMHHIAGADNPADLFTKALPSKDFIKLRTKLCIVPCPTT